MIWVCFILLFFTNSEISEEKINQSVSVFNYKHYIFLLLVKKNAYIETQTSKINIFEVIN